MKQTNFEYLRKLKRPKMLVEAVKLLGTQEIVGDKHNPIILSWAEELGLEKIYKADEIPWCGLFMAICAKRAGWEVPKDPLWALNWSKFGQPVEIPMLGDVLNFKRGNVGGHTCQYVGEDTLHYFILGGNQFNSVCISKKLKTSLHSARRPNWKIVQPKEVQRVFVEANISLSVNEQ